MKAASERDEKKFARIQNAGRHFCLRLKESPLRLPVVNKPRWNVG